ncbi:papain family cysteine protease domain-containing protein [Ditylenchus destructor]|nr:papain family cysteine protease domain-containing protein [Ditylenchus destructor]
MFRICNLSNIFLCIILRVKFGYADSIVVDTLGQNDDNGPPDGWNPSKTDIDEWNDYKKQFSEKANNTEDWPNISERERVFAYMTSKNLTEEHNSKFEQGLVTFNLSLNHLADVPLSYIRQRNNYKVKSKKHNSKIDATIPKSDKGKEDDNLNRRKRETPDSKDYMRFMTPVRNQGQCGSCWAFSSTAALEAHYNIALNNDDGTLAVFAPQQLVDCLAPTSAGSYGCNGNYIDSALLYAKENNGIAKESSYPYTAMDGYCQSVSSSSWHRARITSYHNHYAADLDDNMDENTLKDTLAEVGPIVVVIDANAPKFALYDGGVYYDPECTENPVHAMLLVGYGTDPNYGDYWLIKNSWDTTWGENGYMRLARNKGNHCGITVETAYPVVVDSDDSTKDSSGDEESGSTDSTSDSSSEHSNNISDNQDTKQTWDSSDVDDWNQYVAKYMENVKKWNQKMANSDGTSNDWEQYKKLTAEYKRTMKEYNRRFPGADKDATNFSPNSSPESDSADDCLDSLFC